MPSTNANDPLRTTDHVPSAAPAAPKVTSDFASGFPPADGRTGALVPGQLTEPMATAPEPAPASLSVPGYAIEAVLGRGGMGVVYKARHLRMKRTVALKMVLAGGHAGPRELARFRIEAEAAARLQHPNIVQIHDVGEADGHPYCALEFVEGGNLAGKIAGKPMPAREAAKLVETLARAMQLAHSRNVVHRDLKPANILLTADGNPKITDFGLARQLDSDSGETQAGAVMGTPSYMAPEQASGRAHEAGPPADVYALGAILYACLAGQPPFKGKTVVETLDQVRTQEPAPPSRWQTSVPLDLDTICLKCLSKEPEKRYASAGELADELVRYQQGEPILARPLGGMERAVKWVRRKPAAAALLGVITAAVLLLCGVILGFTFELQAALKDTEKQRDLAEERRKDADKERKRALEQEKQARRDELVARHYWYGANLNLAAQALEAGDSRRLLSILDRQVSSGDQQDLRTFEWHYLARLAHAERLTLRGHTEYPSSLVYAPDGNSLASASAKEIKMWDLTSGRERWTVSLPADGHILVLALSPDGKTLASGWSYQPGQKRQKPLALVQLWDVASGRKISDLCQAAGFGLVEAITFSADGRTLTVAGVSAADPHKRPADRTLYLGYLTEVWTWTSDVAGGRAKKTFVPLPGMQFRELQQAISPDGQTLAFTGFAFFTDKKITQYINGFWDVATAAPRSVVHGQGWGTRSMVLSPDGRSLANVDGSGSLKLRDTGTGQERTAPPWRFGRLGGLAFSVDGVTLAGATEDGSVRRWNLAVGREEPPLLGLAHSTGCLAFSPDGSTLAGGNSDNTIKIWGMAAPQTVVPGVDASAPRIAVTPDGKTLFVGELNQIRVFSLASGKESGRLKGFGEPLPGQVMPPQMQPTAGTTSYVHRLVVSPDGRFLAAAGAHALDKGTSQIMDVWDLASGRRQVHLLTWARWEVWCCVSAPTAAS